MNAPEVLRLRLHNTGLSGSPFTSPSEAVAWLGAVQAQDFAAAKWALGMRVGGSTDSDVDAAFDRGDILRVHLMRPTWHFVLPEDIRWMVKLTAPRVKAVLSSSDSKLELDDALFFRSNAAIVKALQERGYLTRQELKAVLEEIGINTDVQRLAHVIIRAELDGLICSGPKRGKQFTYALVKERAPQAIRLNRTESLARLALRYFSSHGPVLLKDFAWWSGLSTADSATALEIIKPNLKSVELKGNTYWLAQNIKKVRRQPTALLLSIYDEYTIAYRDRALMGDERDLESLISKGNALTSVIIIRGKVAGTWKRLVYKDRVEVRLNLFRPLDPVEKRALESQALRYGRFVGLKAVMTVSA